MKYSIVTADSQSTVTVIHNGVMQSCAYTHPQFNKIIELLLAGDESVLDMIDPSPFVSKKFESISERVSVSNGAVYFDGDQVDNSLTQQILRFMNEDIADWKPLVKFYENVAANPNAHSREQLYEWLQRRDFTITEDGCILGYKALHGNEDDGFYSSSSGKAIVNGVGQQGQIKQNIGDVVEMPRADVQHDPSVGCHTGLHFGEWDYARSFLGSAASVVSVKANPRDIVSVPSDCNSAKVRTCRYTLVEVCEGPIASAVSYDSDFYDEDDDCYYQTCYDCGYELDVCDCDDRY